jgi:hypothetical protein
MVASPARIGVEAGRPEWHAARGCASLRADEGAGTRREAAPRCVPTRGRLRALQMRIWVGVAHTPEPALAASGGRMPGAQPASSERRAGMPEANVRRWGVGNPDLQWTPASAPGDGLCPTTVSRSRRRDGGHGAKIVQSGDGVWATPTSEFGLLRDPPGRPFQPSPWEDHPYRFLIGRLGFGGASIRFWSSPRFGLPPPPPEGLGAFTPVLASCHS